MVKNIWILDDDFSICEALKVILEDVGHEVKRFETGRELVKDLDSTMPDIVLMDVLLTNENGLEIAKAIKDQNRYKHLPLILMSANNVNQADIEASHAQALLRKPFDIYDLVDLVNKYA
jgi:two-component system, OmpR family, phosphate regulon response regulator PhoB